MVVVQVDDQRQSVVVGTEQLKVSLESHVELVRATDYLKEVLFRERRCFRLYAYFLKENAMGECAITLEFAPLFSP